MLSRPIRTAFLSLRSLLNREVEAIPVVVDRPYVFFIQHDVKHLRSNAEGHLRSLRWTALDEDTGELSLPQFHRRSRSTRLDPYRPAARVSTVRGPISVVLQCTIPGFVRRRRSACQTCLCRAWSPGCRALLTRR